MADVFRVGDSSPDVAEARAILARLGLLQDYQGIKPTTKGSTRQYSEEETFFDAPLVEVLQAFQQSRGIVPSGNIDETLLRELRGATYTLGARTLEPRPDPLIGDDVRQLQLQLQELGFYAGRIDGLFGPDTTAAVKLYQFNYALEPDGVCGPETLRALSLLGRRVTGGSPQALREREDVRRAGPRMTGKRVVIDPSLGGKEQGLKVRGRFGEISEEEIVWDLAKRLESKMSAIGTEVILSRPRSSNPTAKERADIANAFGADLLISLQCDRYPNDKAQGVATFFFGSEHGANSITGQSLSDFIQREIAARTDLVNCGHHGRTWEILRLTRMPSVEVVTGYLSNPHDVAILTDPALRAAIAEAIVVAVKRLYLLDDDNQPTGSYQFAELLAAERSGR